MGYPAFHTRLIQVVEWARVIREEGRSLAADFFVPSKHVTSQLWSALSLISFRIQLKIKLLDSWMMEQVIINRHDRVSMIFFF